jgi:hypothetical protein
MHIGALFDLIIRGVETTQERTVTTLLTAS